MNSKDLIENSLGQAKKIQEDMQNWEIQHHKKMQLCLKKAGIDFAKKNLQKIVQQTSFKKRLGRFKENPNSEEFDDSDKHCYGQEKLCHTKINDLNCYLCSCPIYDSSILKKDFENTKILIGACKINSRFGEYYFAEKNSIIGIWDCKGCKAFHTSKAVEAYLKKQFD